MRVKRLQLAILLGVTVSGISGCGHGGQSAADTSPAVNDSVPPATQTECTLIDLAHAANELLSVTAPESVSVEKLRVWVGTRTSEEAAMLEQSSFDTERSTVSAVDAVRQEGPDEVTAGKLTPGDSITLLRSGSIFPPGVARYSDGDKVLGVEVNTDAGDAFLVSAVLTADGLEAGACTDSYNLTLGSVASQLGTDVVSVVVRLVEDTFTQRSLDALIASVETPTTLEPSKASEQYLREWQSVPPSERSLQIGAIPPELSTEVQLSGLWAESAHLTQPVEIAVWSDFGISADFLLPGAEGPMPLVIPVAGTLKVSVRSTGSLSKPAAELELPMPANSALYLSVSDEGAVSVSTISSERYASLLGVSVEDLEALRAGYEATMFHLPEHD